LLGGRRGLVGLLVRKGFLPRSSRTNVPFGTGNVIYKTMKCTDCDEDQPTDKFNPESGSPTVCFKCRVSTVRMGFVAGKSGFHGDDLVGGTIASDNRATLAAAREQGHDPVPIKTAGGVGVSSKELSRLKKANLAKPVSAAL